jgi:hypothetical protein
MRALLKISIVLALLSWAGCYYDNEEDLYPDTGCKTDDVTYSGVIAPILQANCNVCHAAGIQLGGVILDSHDKVLVQVNNGRLLGSIKREPGFSPMPQNQPKLPDCTIEKIEVWIQNGAPNN